MNICNISQILTQSQKQYKKNNYPKQRYTYQSAIKLIYPDFVFFLIFLSTTIITFTFLYSSASYSSFSFSFSFSFVITNAYAQDNNQTKSFAPVNDESNQNTSITTKDNGKSKPEQIKFVLYSDSEPEIEEDSSANKDISITVGQKFIITLKSNPTTGYGWYPIYDERMIVLNSKNYHEDKLDNDKNIVGRGGTEIFTFQGIKVGKTDIKMEYKRPWETSAIDEKNYTIDIGR